MSVLILLGGQRVRIVRIARPPVGDRRSASGEAAWPGTSALWPPGCVHMTLWGWDRAQNSALGVSAVHSEARFAGRNTSVVIIPTVLRDIIVTHGCSGINCIVLYTYGSTVQLGEPRYSYRCSWQRLLRFYCALDDPGTLASEVASRPAGWQ